MNIALFGATRTIGGLFLKLAIDNGDTVYAYARNPVKINIAVMGGRWLMIHVTDERVLEDVEQLIQIRRKVKKMK